MTRYCVLLLLLYVLPARGQTRLNGRYCTLPSPYEDYCLCFLSDSTCIYNESSCITSVRAEGKYKIVRDSLFIFFTKDTARSFFVLNRKKKTTGDSVTVQVSFYRLRNKERMRGGNIAFRETSTRRLRNVRVDSSGKAAFRLARSGEKQRLSTRSFYLQSFDLDIVPDEDIFLSVYLAEQVYHIGLHYDVPKRFKILEATGNTLILSEQIKDNVHVYDFRK